MAELIHLDANTWRYENAGTADSLIVSGTTLTNLSTSQSRTCTAFYQTARTKCFDVPATAEVWIKFDVYFDGTNRWQAFNGAGDEYAYNAGVTAQLSGSLSLVQNSAVIQNTAGTCIKNQLQTVLLHMISGSSDGIIEAWVDGSKIYTYTGDVNHGEDFADIYLQSDGSGTFFSNVIISNAEIGLVENVTCYDIIFKPAIYISWIPRGQLEIKPLLFASILPERFIAVAEKISVDTQRIVKNAEKSAADSFRKIIQDEKFSSDLLRHVISNDSAFADLLRKIAIAEKISADTFRRAVLADAARADTFRQVKDTQRVIADTSRKMGIAIEHADLLRIVKVTSQSRADTLLKIGGNEIISVDTHLTIGDGKPASADLLRRVNDFQRAVADTISKDGVQEKISADTSRAIASHEKNTADTFRQVATTEKASAVVLLRMRDFARADTGRKIICSEKTIARTVIRIPHIFNYFIQPRRLLASKLRSDNTNSLVDTFKQYGVTAINITLAEKTLSDDFRFDIAEPVDIQDTIELNLLDYEFSWIVEETTQTDLIQIVKGKYSVDDLLYTWVTIRTKNDNADEEFDEDAEDGGGYFTASTILKEAGKKLGFDEEDISIAIDDFTPSNIEDGSLMTYADLLNNLFGWTSNVPQRQINVFIRGKKLYCLQRGKEENSVDITNLPHSRLTINRKFNRVLCSNPNANANNDDDDDKTTPFSGTLSFTQNGIFVEYIYKNGLLVKENISSDATDEDGKNIRQSTTTNYSYLTYQRAKEIENKKFNELEELYGIQKPEGTEYKVESEIVETENEYYIYSKEKHTVTETYSERTAGSVTVQNTLVTKTTDTTTYSYKSLGDNEIYLVQEHERNETREYEDELATYGRRLFVYSKERKEEPEVNIRNTYHTPLGNGFYAQTVFLNGLPQGANISQGKPGGAVSQYTFDQVQSLLNSSATTLNKDEVIADTDKLSLIVDNSFPVFGTKFKDQLNEDLRALHRTIVETVTVDLISKVIDGVPEINHVVDFTDKISLDGKNYFLVSNNISFTPRKLIQKLQLIRWELS